MAGKRFGRLILVLALVGLSAVPAGCSGGTLTVTTTQAPAATSPATAAPTATASLVPMKYLSDPCYACHQQLTSGVTQQFGRSTMALSDVSCRDCHETPAGYPGTEAHGGTYRLAFPTPAKCQACHAAEVAQFNQSRHSVPAYVAVHGAQGLAAPVMAIYQAIPEGSFNASKPAHPLTGLEGAAIMPFACDSCHRIGQPNADNSAGRCQECHLTHNFSLAQSRQPETCSACHIGPDHPQWEIFQESAHGIRYATDGASYAWDAAQLTPQNTPAPTCATCHMSGFNGVAVTHDVGTRLGTFLFPATSTARPEAQANTQRMQTICQPCHGVNFTQSLYRGADQVTSSVNDFMKQADAIMADLAARGLLTEAPFDEPIDFAYFDLWHYYGRTTKFGAWMDGPDYTQWHGAYEIVHGLTELKALAAEKLAAAR